MNKLIYTRPEDGGISIIIPAPKEILEKVLGPLTEEEYEKHVRDRSIPANALNVREINNEDLPTSREFRNAWCDVTANTTIDIDCTKAKEFALAKLRSQRNKQLDATDKDMTRALEEQNPNVVNSLKEKRTALRNITEPLKALDTAGKVNDNNLLDQIRQLSVLGDI